MCVAFTVFKRSSIDFGFNGCELRRRNSFNHFSFCNIVYSLEIQVDFMAISALWKQRPIDPKFVIKSYFNRLLVLHAEQCYEYAVITKSLELTRQKSHFCLLFSNAFLIYFLSLLVFFLFAQCCMTLNLAQKSELTNLALVLGWFKEEVRGNYSYHSERYYE